MITWTILFIVLALIASGRFRMDLVAVAGLLVLGLSGAAPPEVIFSGFGHPALATIIAVFLVSQGIVESGLLRGLGQTVARRLHSRHGQTLSIAAVGSTLSAFMNNVGAVGLMLPTAVRMARRSGVDPGSFGLPLAVASILGGTVTLVGSAPNIIIASYMLSATGQSFKMFDFAPHGLAMLGMAFIVLHFCRACGIDPGAAKAQANIDKEASKTQSDKHPGQDSDSSKDQYGQNVKDEANGLDNGVMTGLDEKIIFSPLSSRQKQVALVILLAAVIAVSFDILHPAFGFGSAALLMIVGRVLNLSSAYQSIDLKIVFFLGAMLGIGQTLEHTGALDVLSSALTGFTGELPIFWLIVLLIFVSSFLRRFLSFIFDLFFFILI